MDCFNHSGLYSEMNKWEKAQSSDKNDEMMGEQRPQEHDIDSLSEGIELPGT